MKFYKVKNAKSELQTQIKQMSDLTLYVKKELEATTF